MNLTKKVLRPYLISYAVICAYVFCANLFLVFEEPFVGFYDALQTVFHFFVIVTIISFFCFWPYMIVYRFFGSKLPSMIYYVLSVILIGTVLVGFMFGQDNSRLDNILLHLLIMIVPSLLVTIAIAYFLEKRAVF